MFKIILVTVCVVASAIAAPTTTQDDSNSSVKTTSGSLARPAPINPEVLSDPKPTEDKTTLIEDKDHSQKHTRNADSNEKGYSNSDSVEQERKSPSPIPSSEGQSKDPKDHSEHGLYKRENSEPINQKGNLDAEKSKRPVDLTRPASLQHNQQEKDHKLNKREDDSKSHASTLPVSVPENNPNRKPYQPSSRGPTSTIATTSATSSSSTPSSTASSKLNKRDIPVPVRDEQQQASTTETTSVRNPEKTSSKVLTDNKNHKRSTNNDDDSSSKEPKSSLKDISTAAKADPSTEQHAPTYIQPVPVSQIFGKRSSEQ